MRLANCLRLRGEGAAPTEPRGAAPTKPSLLSTPVCKLEKKPTKLFNRKPCVSNNTTQRKCIDRVMARNGQDALAVTHNDVLTLTHNPKSGLFERAHSV